VWGRRFRSSEPVLTHHSSVGTAVFTAFVRWRAVTAVIATSVRSRRRNGMNARRWCRMPGLRACWRRPMRSTIIAAITAVALVTSITVMISIVVMTPVALENEAERWSAAVISRVAGSIAGVIVTRRVSAIAIPVAVWRSGHRAPGDAESTERR
jgi:hypothetical protein